MTERRRQATAIPWILALVGLAIPMVGGGFAGWPFVVGWLVILAVIWWIRPLGGADRRAKLTIGAGVIVALVAFATLGGLYLIPAVIAWLVLVATEQPPAHTKDQAPQPRYP